MIKAHGFLRTGDNTQGQLGLPGYLGCSEPCRVKGVGHWASVSFGQGHAAGIASKGKLFCWGRHDLGQCGAGKPPHLDEATARAAMPTKAPPRPPVCLSFPTLIKSRHLADCK